MNRSSYTRLLILLIGLSLTDVVNAQSYIKRLNNLERSLRQKITRFKNGDILIGDSSFEGSLQGATAPVFLTRMDQCGVVVWSYAYEKKNIQLEFKDFAVNDKDQIFMIGSAVDGLRESIFLLEIDGNGAKKRFRSFNSGASSNTSFSLALQNEKILIFGRLLKIGASTTGFMAIFDDRLNFQWGKEINPFTHEGGAIIDANGEFVGRSGAFHFKFDEGGNLQWASQFDRNLEPNLIAGPIEVTGGYLFEAYAQGEAFVYKLDPTGRLLWKSAVFSSTQFPAAVQEINNGNLIVHYSAPEEKGNSLRRLRLSPSGEILQKKKFNSGFSFNIGSVFHSVNDDEIVNVIGNKDALSTASVDMTDYLIQFSLQEAASECFDWLDVERAIPNNYPLTFPDLGTAVSDLDLQESTSGGLDAYAIESPFYEVCGAVPEPNLVRIDTLMDCKENWLVGLPSTEFIWEDNYPTSQRLLEETGIYRAKNNDCGDPVAYEFQLKRKTCDCSVFLPNAFSPNGDGQNDLLQLFTDCQLSEIQASVFDRWGNLLYRGQNPEQLWDGTVEREQAREGIYILMVNYQLLSESGGKQQGTLAREVLLIR